MGSIAVLHRLGGCTNRCKHFIMKLSEIQYTRSLRSLAAKKAAFPDLSNEALTAAYPGRCQSLTQVLSTADARLSGLTEKTR